MVCPSGFFSLGEDGTTLEKVEEYAPASTEDMLQLTAWGHRYPHIKVGAEVQADTLAWKHLFWAVQADHHSLKAPSFIKL